MTDREMATVLGPLRYYQAKGLKSALVYDIVTRGGVEPLDAEEIDVLCERLNLGKDQS